MNEISKAAKLLSSLQIGKPKHYSEEEIAKRTIRLAEARKKRWPKNNEDSAVNKV
jgi:hypothetical protein